MQEIQQNFDYGICNVSITSYFDRPTVMATAESLAEVTDVVQILRQWEEDHVSPSYDPIPTLQRLAEIIEVETENYLKMDPDPFDERHPSRTDPECNFGHILKVLFRKDNFMTKVTYSGSLDR